MYISPLLSPLYRRLLPVQTNVDDHKPSNCSLFAEQGTANVDGGFLPADGSVINNETICSAAEFTPAPATVSLYISNPPSVYITNIMYNVYCILKTAPVTIQIIINVNEHTTYIFPLQAWAYMLGGLIIYSIERIVRLVRSLRKVVIVKVVEHPSRLLRYR